MNAVLRKDGITSFSLLFLIVLQRFKGHLGQHQNCNQVHHHHEPHEQISQIPYQLHFGYRTKHPHRDNANAVYPQPNFVGFDKLNVGFSIVIISD
ncbi:hypothetical protein D3C76_1477530 [compost metagenome]